MRKQTQNYSAIFPDINIAFLLSHADDNKKSTH